MVSFDNPFPFIWCCRPLKSLETEELLCWPDQAIVLYQLFETSTITRHYLWVSQAFLFFPNECSQRWGLGPLISCMHCFVLPCASLAVQSVCLCRVMVTWQIKPLVCFYLFQLTMTRLLHFYANPTFLRCCRSVSPAWPETTHSGTAFFQTAEPYFQEALFVVGKNRF